MSNLADVLATIQPLDGWLSSHEGFLLYSLARSVGKGEIVELGSWKGKSTICLASGTKIGKKAKVTAIDPHLGEYSWGKGIGKKAPTYKEFLQNLRKAGVAHFVTPLVATSEKAARTWQRKITLLFIDGLHDYKHAYQDYSLWNPFVAENGYIAFHDAFCGHKGPEKVMKDNILFTNLYKDIGVVGSIIYIQKGKAESMTQTINILRHRVLLPLAAQLHTSSLPRWLSFFLIHRVIKLLLINRYTLQISFHNYEEK